MELLHECSQVRMTKPLWNGGDLLSPSRTWWGYRVLSLRDHVGTTSQGVKPVPADSSCKSRVHGCDAGGVPGKEHHSPKADEGKGAQAIGVAGAQRGSKITTHHLLHKDSQLHSFPVTVAFPTKCSNCSIGFLSNVSEGKRTSSAAFVFFGL